MHALTILHRILSTVFQNTRETPDCLLAAVESSLREASSLKRHGRGIHGRVAVKHNIKRIDRCWQDSLHTEIPKLYEALIRQFWGYHYALIVIDWSDLTPDGMAIVTCSVASRRSMTLLRK